MSLKMRYFSIYREKVMIDMHLQILHARIRRIINLNGKLGLHALFIRPGRRKHNWKRAIRSERLHACQGLHTECCYITEYRYNRFLVPAHDTTDTRWYQHMITLTLDSTNT